MKIREAQPKDISEIYKLIKLLAVFERAGNEVELTESQLLEDGFGASPKYKAFVADVQGDIRGMALVYYKYSTWKGLCLHLEDLIVHQDYRGKGYGKRLLDRVLKLAKDQGLKRVDWQVLDWNTPAVEFYESVGANIEKEWWSCRLNQQGIESYV
ncbi:MAG: GNAT family N-acetyltransferase [Flavobacteriales bacterium]